MTTDPNQAAQAPSTGSEQRAAAAAPAGPPSQTLKPLPTLAARMTKGMLIWIIYLVVLLGGVGYLWAEVNKGVAAVACLCSVGFSRFMMGNLTRGAKGEGLPGLLAMVTGFGLALAPITSANLWGLVAGGVPQVRMPAAFGTIAVGAVLACIPLRAWALCRRHQSELALRGVANHAESSPG